jgi:hypothetical protein
VRKVINIVLTLFFLLMITVSLYGQREPGVGESKVTIVGVNIPANEATYNVSFNNQRYGTTTNTRTTDFIIPNGQYTCTVTNITDSDMSGSVSFSAFDRHITLTLANFGAFMVKTNTQLTSRKKVSRGDIISFNRYNWRVLDVVDNRALIITEKLIEERKFDASSNNWTSSEIRHYLNNDFYNTFNYDEKNRIDNGNDKIFLLSVQEAQKYFSGDIDRIALNIDDYNMSFYHNWWLRTPWTDEHYVYRILRDGRFSNCSARESRIGVRPALWLKL